MTRRPIFLDSFSGALAELPPGRRTVADALRALSRDPRVSTFERGKPWLERLIRELLDAGLVVEDKAEPYPWHRFVLTEAGRAALQNSPTEAAKQAR
jgi:hypothetical protein